LFAATLWKPAPLSRRTLQTAASSTSCTLWSASVVPPSKLKRHSGVRGAEVTEGVTVDVPVALGELVVVEVWLGKLPTESVPDGEGVDEEELVPVPEGDGVPVGVAGGVRVLDAVVVGVPDGSV